MDKNEETFATWNKVAKLYEEKFMDLNLYNDSYDLFCAAIIQQNASILEVGCGPGNITKYLLRKRPDLKITGIDFSPNMIALAAANNPSATFDVMDCKEINKIQQKFDGIISGFCLPYLSADECEKFIEDAALLLNNEGILYISFVEGDYAASGFKAGSTGDRTYFYYHRLLDLKSKLAAHNFDIVKGIKLDYTSNKPMPETHNIVVSKKQRR